MKKLTEGYIDCLIRGIQKGYIWTCGDSWAGKSYQKNERYVTKLEHMGLIIKDSTRTFKEFYIVTDEGKKLVENYLAEEKKRIYNNKNINTMEKEFTLMDAFNIQSEHLYEWSIVLNAEAYRRLLYKTREATKGVSKPYSIPRGSTLSGFVEDIKREMVNQI